MNKSVNDHKQRCWHVGLVLYITVSPLRTEKLISIEIYCNIVIYNNGDWRMQDLAEVEHKVESRVVPQGQCRAVICPEKPKLSYTECFGTTTKWQIYHKVSQPMLQSSDEKCSQYIRLILCPVTLAVVYFRFTIYR